MDVFLSFLLSLKLLLTCSVPLNDHDRKCCFLENKATPRLYFIELGFVGAFKLSLYWYIWELGAPKLNFSELRFVGALKLTGEGDCRACGNQLCGEPLSAGCYGAPKPCLRPWVVVVSTDFALYVVLHLVCPIGGAKKTMTYIWRTYLVEQKRQ